jgi:AraC family transcriptional regulator of arabinose operon
MQNNVIMTKNIEGNKPMEIHVIGYNHSHDKSFVIDRPNGISSWLFLLIKTPAVFIQDGIEINIRENSFVLFTNEVPQYYCTYGEKYVDDWFHFSVDDADKEFISTLKIPLNTVTWLGDNSELSKIIHNMAYEFHITSPYNTDIIEHYLKIFFIKLSRKLHIGLQFPSEKIIEKYKNMIHIRIRIYSMPQSISSVKEMSKELSMSVSSFQHTYKKIFGVNVMTDVINSRLEHARGLLATTDLTLDSIAVQSGYSNAFHLMRQFKDKYGLTPTEYRNTL